MKVKPDRITKLAELEQAIEALPFECWPTRDVQSGILLALDALKSEYGSHHRSEMLFAAITQLMTAASKNRDEEDNRLRWAIHGALYSTTGKLKRTDEIDVIGDLDEINSKLLWKMT